MPEQFFPCRTAAHGRTHTRAEERCQMEGETERICYRLTVAIPMPHCIDCGVGAGSGRREVELGRGRETMLLCFIACLGFSLPKSIFIGNTLNSFSPSQVFFTHNSNWHAVSLTLSQPTSFLILFCSPVP